MLSFPGRVYGKKNKTNDVAGYESRNLSKYVMYFDDSRRLYFKDERCIMLMGISGGKWKYEKIYMFYYCTRYGSEPYSLQPGGE